MTRPHYLIRLGDALSQLLNVALLNGDANESISGRAHREGWKTAERIINWLLRPLGPDHCRTAYLEDVARAWELVKESA
jgi:hypothetical protein